MHGRTPGLSYLTGATVGDIRVDGVPLGPVKPEVLADVDEVEFVHTYADRLRVTVRHTFASGWGLRVAFSSLTPSRQRIDGAQLQLDPDPGCVAWGLALGVTTAYVVSPATGDGPLLAGLLRQGSVDRVTPGGLELTPFELRPEGRYVLQLHWDWYPSAKVLRQEHYVNAPSALFVPTGEAVSVRVDEDVAVVAPTGVETSHGADRLEAVSEVAGRFAFELRSARGTTRIDLQWVDPVEELLRRSVPEALSRPRTAAGVLRLVSVAEALVVQHGLAIGVVDDPDDAAEALDLFTARLDRTRTLTPLEMAYLCREFDRVGDLELLEEASEAVLARPAPAPGLAIAATQLCLGLLVSGRDISAVLGHLSQLAQHVRSAVPTPGRLDVSAQAAALEILAVTQAGPGLVGPGSVGPATDEAAARQRVAALGLRLGAGLVGQAVHPKSTDDVSHLVAVFQLLPEALSASMSRHWGCSAHALARAATPELLARLSEARIGEAHAWLVLALQTS